MKRVQFIFIILIISTLLVSCGSGGGESAGVLGLFDSGSSNNADFTQAAPAAPPTPMAGSSFRGDEMQLRKAEEEGMYNLMAEPTNPASNGETLVAQAVEPEQSTRSLGEMLIYTSEVQMESADFDETIESFQAMVKEYSAFFENSYIAGSSYTNQMRYANYKVRIPKEHFEKMQARFEGIGNVLYIRTSAENITAQFYDTESRLNTYRTEESRLLAMLEKSETVEEMIQVESRLSEVRYQIESLTGTLRNWKNQVDYCTIDISIREVVKLSDSNPYPRTYAEELGFGVVSTIDTMGDFFRELFKAIVVLSPVLLMLALLLIGLLALRKRRRKRRSLEQVDGSVVAQVEASQVVKVSQSETSQVILDEASSSAHRGDDQ